MAKRVISATGLVLLLLCGRAARLALDRGNDARAETHLAAVKKASTVPSHLFLASLWLGQIRERQKPWTAAAELYVEAIKTQPDARSAYVLEARFDAIFKEVKAMKDAK